MRSITIRAEDALIDALDARAEADGTSRNAVAVEALQSHLHAKTPESECAASAPGDCEASADDCTASAPVLDLLAAQLAEKDRQLQQMAEALRESMAATAEALKTAQAAQAIQAASRPGLVERIRGFFAREVSGQ